MKGPQLLILGAGGLGGWVLELAARDKRFHWIVLADVNEEYGEKKVLNARTGAAYHGRYPRIDFEQIDLLKEEQTAETINRLQPEVIINCTTLLSWWVTKQVPPEVLEKLEKVGFGPWLPMHLALTRRLMKAVKQADYRGSVINGSFPDAVNPVLGKLNLAPLCGLGNFDLLYPALKLEVGRRLGINSADVDVIMVMHHFHTSFFRKHAEGPSPYYLKINVGGEDISSKWNRDQLLYEASKNRLEGAEINPQVASSGLRIVHAVLENSSKLIHVPGPNGLPGGYPTLIYRDKAEVSLPGELPLAGAVKMNEEAGKRDGIEKIEEDGRVVFTEQAAEAMKDNLGYDCPVLDPEEDFERARELIGLFKKIAR